MFKENNNISTTVLVTYSFQNKSAAVNATDTTVNAISDNVTGFIGLIVLITVASLLIFLVRKGLRG